MKMTITGRKVTVRPSFVERTEKKLSKLDKFFEDSVTADVTVSKENANKQRVEITIRTGIPCGALQELPRQAAGCGGSHSADEHLWTSVLYVPQHGLGRNQRGV